MAPTDDKAFMAWLKKQGVHPDKIIVQFGLAVWQAAKQHYAGK